MKSGVFNDIISPYHPKANKLKTVSTSIITEATLVEHHKGKELEYGIIEVNKTGKGEASNTEIVVL